MHAAAIVGHLSVCKQLIGAGADHTIKNQENYTAAELALHNKHNILYEYLKGCCNRPKWHRVQEMNSFIPANWSFGDS